LKKNSGIKDNYLNRLKDQCKAYLDIAPSPPAEARPVLSERELEVLRLMAQGKSRAEVAAACHVQANTVKAQLSSAYKKLGARSRIEAVRLAKTYELI